LNWRWNAKWNRNRSPTPASELAAREAIRVNFAGEARSTPTP
jgi:hypothetical protein